MKKVLLAIALCAAFLRPAGAQLEPANESGMTMGHVHMNVRDVEAHKKFWMDLGATPIKVGQAEAVKMPGFIVVLRRQEPTGPMDGSVLNHMGVLVPNFATLISKLEAIGTKIDKPRPGSDPAMPQTSVYGPDEFRLELTESSTLKTPIAGHHIHYNVPNPTQVKEWYAATLLAKPGKRANWEAADVPGMNLTYAGLPQARPTPAVATKGRIVDHIGFEVRNLEAFVKRLQADGVALDSPLKKDPEMGISSVFITDPWGTSIELTEGLTKF